MDDRQPQVLLVDDSEDVHRLVRAKLKHESVDLTSARDGAEGVRRAKEIRPAAVLLDLDMPGMDGFSVIRALKDDPSTGNIPILVLSGLDNSGDKVTAFDLGAMDYITKPFDFAELRARLRAALRLDRLLRLLAERAEVDGLTGLGNRPCFDKRLTQEVALNRRHGTPFSLALLDIDFFKRINDTFGHPAGDEVLQRFAQLLMTSCRAADVAFRYGGEEFALLMPHTSAEDARTLAERVRQSLQSLRWARHPEHPVTVSIGLVGVVEGCPGLEPAAWLEAADKALYAAKRTGRNKVEVTALPTRPVLAQAG